MGTRSNTKIFLLLLMLSTLQPTAFGFDCFVNNFQSYNNSIAGCDDEKSLTFNVKAPWERIPQKLIDRTQKIQTIIVDGQSLTAIDNKGFCSWSNLKTISANGNNIRTLPSRMFTDCRNLKNLSIMNSSVNEIYSDAFHGLTLLERLDLAMNNISSLPDIVFKDLPSLKTLRLNNNRIEVIDKETFERNLKLKLLDLSYNNIQIIETASFWKLEQLETINLSFNLGLKVVDFTGMDQLHHISIEGDLLRSLHIPKCVMTVNANSNRITHLNIDLNSALDNLYLKNNSLRDIKELSQATQLTLLDISNNNITDIDFSYLMSTQIRDLIVLDNPIRNFNVKALTNKDTVRSIEISIDNLDNRTLTDLVKETSDKHIALRDPNRDQERHNSITTPPVTPDSNNDATTTQTTPKLPDTSAAPVPLPNDNTNSLLERIQKLESIHSFNTWVIIILSVFVLCQITMFFINNYKRWNIPIPNIFAQNGISNGHRNHIINSSMDPIMEDTF